MSYKTTHAITCTAQIGTHTTKGLIKPFVASHLIYTHPSELLEKSDEYLHF